MDGGSGNEGSADGEFQREGGGWAERGTTARAAPGPNKQFA